MFKFKFRTIQKKILADSTTPIKLYLQLRDYFANILLLEFFDSYVFNKKSISIFCINPIAELILDDKIFKIYYPNKICKHIFIKNNFEIKRIVENFFYTFENKDDLKMKSSHSGLYGYVSYDCIQYFENIKLRAKVTTQVPEMRIGFYKNIIIFNHTHNELRLIEHEIINFDNSKYNDITYIDRLIDAINNKKYFSFFPFRPIGHRISNVTDKEYKQMVSKGIESCFRGDVFQIVLSRQFKQKFTGDDFNVYRALRCINPSPYLFYFDYGNYKLFGSSPESQLTIKNNIAYINPIAGTIKKLNNKKILNEFLRNPKENAEHIMLVDLARNDLSKNSINVKVEKLKEIKKFSHVLHMTSTVSGTIEYEKSIFQIFEDTFPAGTLSGAPKYKAIELIDKIENQKRGVYGGAIGFWGFNNTCNTAILIRSFLSQNNVLFFQAGAGIVAYSKEDKELEEIHNKLMALFKSINLAKNISKCKKYENINYR